MYFHCFSQSSIKKYCNKGIKSFYPVTRLNGLLNLLLSGFHCFKTDNVFTLFDLILEMNWKKCVWVGDKRKERNQKRYYFKKWEEINCHKIPAHIPVFCKVLNLQLLTSVQQKSPHSVPAAQDKVLCQSHDSFSLPSWKACMSYQRLHHIAKPFYSPFEKSPDLREGGEENIWSLIQCF